MSHSIQMLSIQIDSKTTEIVIQHQINNINLSFFVGRTCTLIRLIFYLLLRRLS